ncbi:MAG: dTDP-4-dehydrorhamnose 3,5-epimerase [Sedimentisphaerales bacterium]|nr:dTDP-4-dehydrorhamnose 3,5-epimerase [Sedimentisphaerales bacterium]
MIKTEPAKIKGCLKILPFIAEDQRGAFVKTFHSEEFAKLGLATDFVEEYHSFSHKGVLRGLHFQMPPHDHTKLVYCLSGKAFDAVVDLRKESPTYGKFETFELSPDNRYMLYVPRGLAHGFCALEDNTVMVYKVTSVHAPEYDSGIRWDSAGIPWPTDNPIVSERDSQFEKLSDFETPFLYKEQ